MDLKFYWKKFCSYMYNRMKRLNDTLHRWSIQTHYNIHIAPSVTVAGTAKIDIVMGGSISINEDTQILDGVLILTYGGNIKIGSNCNINPYTIIYGHGNTTIGNNVLLAGGCMIVPNSHKFDKLDVPIINQGCTANGITIGDDVWIGHGCSILDNVTIGEGSVIAAGSVVNTSIPPFSIAAGVPAKIVKSRK